MDSTDRPQASNARPTMQEVARFAGVGVKTVSRVVNAEPHVSPAMVARVQHAINTLGYQPDFRAGALRRGREPSRVIGLLLGCSSNNPFSATVQGVVSGRARERQSSVMSGSLDREEPRERQAIDALLRHRVDGLIVATPTHDLGYLAEERQRGVGLVVVDGVARGVNCDTVNSENRAGAELAVEHLVKHGHRHIAYVGPDRDVDTIAARRAGFLGQARREGLRVPDKWLLDDLDCRGHCALEEIEELLTGPDRPTAIFSAQNQSTVDVVRVLRSLGLEDSIALVGFDDFPLADLLMPGVTVIAQDAERIGEIAAERLFAQIDGKAGGPQHVVLPVRLIERGSGEIGAA